MAASIYIPESHSDTIKLLDKIAPKLNDAEEGLGTILDAKAHYLASDTPQDPLHKKLVTDEGILAAQAKSIIEDISMLRGMIASYASSVSIVKGADNKAALETKAGATKQDLERVKECIGALATHRAFKTHVNSGLLGVAKTIKFITHQVTNKTHFDTPTVSPALIEFLVDNKLNLEVLCESLKQLPPGEHTKDLVEAVMGTQSQVRGIARKAIPGRKTAEAEAPAASASDAQQDTPLIKALNFIAKQSTWSSAMVGALEHPQGAELLATMNQASAALASKAKGTPPLPPP